MVPSTETMNRTETGEQQTNQSPADAISVESLPLIDVDQYKWTQHNQFWREDFRRAREDLGIRYLRYALPWHVLEPNRGEFHWDMADERIQELSKLGINPMLDVMHFGTPLWL